MPIVTIDFLEGRTVEQKREMAKRMTEVLVETVKCKPENVTIVIRDAAPENIATNGKLKLDQ